MNKMFSEKWQFLKNFVAHVQTSVATEEEPYIDTVFKQFFQDCIVYDANPHSTIDQDRNKELIEQLFITYIEYMLNKQDLQKFLESFQECQNKTNNTKRNNPFCVPYPYGSVIMPNIKTLQYAKFSPLIFKLHELRIHDDQIKKEQNDLIVL